MVNTQRFGRPGNRVTIQGVRTDEYTVNLIPGFLPVVPYSATIDGVAMPFEAISATTVGTTAGAEYVYEPSPRPNGEFNILFRNDQKAPGTKDPGDLVHSSSDRGKNRFQQ